MFTYSPLNPEKPEIRLVRFSRNLEANDRDAIELELRHALIGQDDAHYVALSYVWGDGSDKKEIHVDGSQMSVGRNLHAALRQFRDNGLSSWFWVDSICIRQSDSEEKTHQVGHMKQIFSQADIVYVWLGSGCTASDVAMDFVSSMGPDALKIDASELRLHYRHQVRQHLRKVLGTPTAWEDEDSPPAGVGGGVTPERIDALLNILRTFEQDEQIDHGLHNIMTRDYWHRIWIIQEIFLAQDVRVMCGDRLVSLDFFDAVVSAVDTIVWFAHWDRSWLPSGARAHMTLLHGTSFNCIALDTRRLHVHENCPPCLYNVLVHSQAPADRPFYSATDPRDLVFGVLGMITDAESLGLRVDYSMTPTEVFCTATKALLRDEADGWPRFRLDRCVPRKDGALCDLPLPSWVPDWREVGRYGFKICPTDHYGQFDASSGMEPPLGTDEAMREGEKLEILRVYGCIVDVVTEVMAPPEWVEENEWSPSFIKDGPQWITSIREFVKLGKSSGPAEDYIWRTASCDSLHERPGRAPGRHVGVTAEEADFIRRIMRDDAINAEELTPAQTDFIKRRSVEWRRGSDQPAQQQLRDFRISWLDTMGSVARSRTLFKTAKEMLGRGHVAVQVGDIVTLIHGVTSPVVLRPRAKGGFLFVGDTYVDGIMHGEFLRTLPTFEVFDLH
jgi:hypothetical protein